MTPGHSTLGWNDPGVILRGGSFYPMTPCHAVYQQIKRDLFAQCMWRVFPVLPGRFFFFLTPFRLRKFPNQSGQRSNSTRSHTPIGPLLLQLRFGTLESHKANNETCAVEQVNLESFIALTSVGAGVGVVT